MSFKKGRWLAAGITTVAIGAALVLSFAIPSHLSVTPTAAADPPTEIVLNGTVRDFKSGDLEFIGSGSLGHFAGNIQRWLPGDHRPTYVGGGYRVDVQWRDSSGRAIAPHLSGVRGGGSGERLGLRVNGAVAITEATIDAYNSNYGPYGVGGNYASRAIVTTNSTATGDFKMGKSVIRGDVMVGPGGIPGAVIAMDDSAITGTQSALGQPFAMPALAVPSDPLDLESHQPLLNHTGGTFTLTGDLDPDDLVDAKALWYTDVTFDNATINIAGDLRIRCDGQLTVRQSSIVLAAGTALTIYVNSSSNVEIQESSINTTDGDSTLVTINYVGTGDIRCSQNSHVCATIVAPSGVLDIDKSHVYGGYIGQSLKLHGIDGDGAGLHVDLSNATLGQRNFALTARKEIKLDDNAVIDSFDSTLGPFGAGNSGSAALISCNSFDKPEKVTVKNSRIEGDLFIGPDGDIAKVVKLEGSGVITGSIGRLAEPTAIPVIAAPNLGASVGDVFYSNQTVTLSSDLHCKKLHLDKATMLISGDVTIRSDDKIELRDNSEIRLLQGASLVIYVKKDLKLEDDCRLNMNGSTCGDPKAVSIRRTSVGKKGRVHIKKKSMLSAWIQGAKTELKLEEDSHFYGSFIGRKVEIKKNSTVHVDMAYFSQCVNIADVGGIEGPAGPGRITSAEAFSAWYRDIPGTNVSMTYPVTLRLNMANVYEYLDDDFHPIDSRLFGDEGESHNNYFTYRIAGEFDYVGCGGQYVEFEGGDGAWLYIDGRLVMDLGGTGAKPKQHVDLDRFGLKDGETYEIHLFYAQRQSTASIFRLRTNLEISTSGQTPTVSSMFD